MAAPQYAAIRPLCAPGQCPSPSLAPPVPQPRPERKSEPSSKQWHHSFPPNDTDFTLRSLEGTLYGVYTYTLRKTCGFFATMFTLPRCIPADQGPGLKSNSHSGDIHQVLDVYEPDAILSLILSLLFGLPVPAWESLDQAERVLALAEKFDAPGAIASIRLTLFAPKFRDTDPLRLYAIARHFEWNEEARQMPRYTLVLNLYDPAHSAVLARMASKYIIPLFDLHRRRKDMFREMLDSPERFTAGNSEPYHCSRCGVTELENYTWREYKQVLLLEIERRPLGDQIGLLSSELSDCAEARACWDAKCAKEGCGGLNYDRYATLKQIRNCVLMLPDSIEE